VGGGWCGRVGGGGGGRCGGASGEAGSARNRWAGEGAGGDAPGCRPGAGLARQAGGNPCAGLQCRSLWGLVQTWRRPGADLAQTSCRPGADLPAAVACKSWRGPGAGLGQSLCKPRAKPWRPARARADLLRALRVRPRESCSSLSGPTRGVPSGALPRHPPTSTPSHGGVVRGVGGGVGGWGGAGGEVGGAGGGRCRGGGGGGGGGINQAAGWRRFCVRERTFESRAPLASVSGPARWLRFGPVSAFRGLRLAAFQSQRSAF
jgi:hypothetical protein